MFNTNNAKLTHEATRRRTCRCRFINRRSFRACQPVCVRDPRGAEPDSRKLYGYWRAWDGSNTMPSLLPARSEAAASRLTVLAFRNLRNPSSTTTDIRARIFSPDRSVSPPVIGIPITVSPQDRLLLIYRASLATWQKSRIIRFSSAAAVLETFGLQRMADATNGSFRL
jgi:hypothetical protein